VPTFRYPCPGCRTTNSLHDADCDFEGVSWPTIEKAYTDLLTVLTAEPDGMAESTLREAIHSEWSGLHKAALGALEREQRVVEDGDRLRLLTAAEFKELVSEPTRDPMRTVYEYGSVPGCHDNAVFAMVAWYEMVGLVARDPRERRRVAPRVRRVGPRWLRGVDARGARRRQAPRVRRGLRLEGEGTGREARDRAARVGRPRGRRARGPRLPGFLSSRAASRHRDASGGGRGVDRGRRSPIPGRRQPRRALAVVIGVVFIDLVGFGIVIPILPFYVRSFGVSDAFIGLLAASYSLAQFLAAPTLGRLSDRIGRRPVLLASLATAGVAW